MSELQRTAGSYIYANADPVNMIDPTGMSSMAEASATTRSMSSLSTMSVGRVAVSFAANDAVIAGTATASSKQVGF